LGSQIENKTGHLRFALIYIVSGLAGSTASTLHILNSGLGNVSVSAGASGAIYGILGVFIVWILFDKKNGILRMKRQNRNVAYRRLLIVIVLVLSQGYFDPEVDATAHTAGLIVGTLLGLVSMLTKNADGKYKIIRK
jgi:rhomboid protease GluP